MIALTLLLACAPEEQPAPEPAPELPACAGALGTRVGECAPAFVLPTADGGSFRLQDHLGEVAVVHVASTGSALDEGASALISQLLAERGDFAAVDVLALDPISPPLGQDDALAWQGELAQVVAWDETEQFGRDWADTGLTPTLLVLDPTGQVLARMHEQYDQQLPAALDAALP
jgi:hypothetical protein